MSVEYGFHVLGVSVVGMCSLVVYGRCCIVWLLRLIWCIVVELWVI